KVGKTVLVQQRAPQRGAVVDPAQECAALVVREGARVEERLARLRRRPRRHEAGGDAIAHERKAGGEILVGGERERRDRPGDVAALALLLNDGLDLAVEGRLVAPAGEEGGEGEKD